MTVKSPTIQPQYEALGIHPDTMTCVAILPTKDAKEYVWALAQTGIATQASRDADDKKLFHVAVIGGLAYNPGAYFASITGGRPRVCHGRVAERGQHPLAVGEEGE